MDTICAYTTIKNHLFSFCEIYVQQATGLPSIIEIYHPYILSVVGMFSHLIAAIVGFVVSETLEI